METAVVESVTGLPTWAQILVLLSMSMLAAKTIDMVGTLLIQRAGRFGSHEYDRILIEELHTPLYVTVFLLGVYGSAQLIPQFGLDFYVGAVATSMILVVWASAVIQLGNRIISATNNSPSGRHITPVFKNLLTFFVILGSFFLLLSVWAVDITPLLASAGVIGIVIGIAARDSLGNFFSGISLYLDKTYKVGDMLQLGSGVRGTVLDMSIRSTTLLTRDNIAVTIPNAEMNSTQIINESAPVRRRRIRLDVGVAYGSDLDTVKTALLEVAADEALVLETPSPEVRFREFADSAIVAQLQAHIEHPALRGRTRHQLIERIDERFLAEGIKIPFPQRELTFFEAGNTVRLDGSQPTDAASNGSTDCSSPTGSVGQSTTKQSIDRSEFDQPIDR